jgi:hypothetical protein
MPSLQSSFPNNEFHAAVQNAVGAPLGLLNQAIGLPIKSTTNGPTPKVDPFGSNVKNLGQRLEEEHCGITTRSWVFCRSAWHGPRYHIAEASKASHRPARTCSAGSAPDAGIGSDGVEGTKTLQEITPDLLIDGHFLSTTLDGVGASLLRGTRH